MSLNFQRPTLKPGVKSDIDEDDELLAAQEEFLRSQKGPSVRVHRVRKPAAESTANTNNTAQEVKTEESEFKKGVSFANDAKSGDGKPKKQSRFKQQRLHQQLEQDITDVKPDPRFEKKIIDSIKVQINKFRKTFSDSEI